MITYTIDRIDHKNKGIAREWALCHHYNIERSKHDSLAYDKGSDLDTADGKHISIKASAFTLMSGSLCEGLEDFNGIWNLYESRVHSDTFAYVTTDYTVFEMNISEFKQFVYAFGHIEHESTKNGGQAKIRCQKESAKMLAWFMERVAQATRLRSPGRALSKKISKKS